MANQAHMKAVAPDQSARKTVAVALTVLKYLISLALAAAASSMLGDWRYVAVSAAELLAIFALTNWLVGLNPIAGNIVNSLLILVFNLQTGVLLFGSTYISPIMLSNLFNLRDLAGKATTYIGAAVAAVVASFLPVAGIAEATPARGAIASLLAVALEAGILLGGAAPYAPMASSIDLVDKWNSYQALIAEAGANADEVDVDGHLTAELQRYYCADVPGGIDKPAVLPERPNVIVIFTEGLSQSVIDDEREIMPNVARIQQESFAFTNYYCHTAATFRGLNGQLFSGYQLEDLDTNALVSIQDIFKDQGYSTTFINTEPHHEKWTDFLGHMDFEDLRNESVTGTYSLSTAKHGGQMTDGEAYQTLEAVIQEKSELDRPFFIGIYTFNTHVSLDSAEEQFEDGSNPLLNRFHNCDYQFGQFIEWFKESEYFDNTILVFTADHSTYIDMDYLTSFPDNDRESVWCDVIPCFYYYKGVEAGEKDVNGRNSLDFAPTLLDYLDISAPNFFLGRSLFLEPDENCLDTVFFEGVTVVSSRDGIVGSLEPEEEEKVREELMEYISISRISLEADDEAEAE